MTIRYSRRSFFSYSRTALASIGAVSNGAEVNKGMLDT